ncbi:MAG: glycosyl hydrolase [Cyclobacteriaceae bacterium]|nr:glycosyl hydrolase [Cyclobacteriaceae bacterium]
MTTFNFKTKLISHRSYFIVEIPARLARPVFFFPPPTLAILSFFCLASCTREEKLTVETIWPEITSQTKPWTRWWWMGNAVNKPEIERQLILLADAGFGGVEITPIYGAKGYEDQYIDFLSDEWMDMLQFTIAKADSLGMGVDMNLGTGWPFGGPQINPEFASSRLILQHYEVKKGEQLSEKIIIKDPRQIPENVDLLAVMAYEADGQSIDITNLAEEDGSLVWTAPADCKIVAAFNGKTGQKVKRASPGGQGWTLDHFSQDALDVYLGRFDAAFSKIAGRPRAFFNDSYEVYGSTGTKNIFIEFEKRRGYDLKDHLLHMNADDTSEVAKRIQSDYRETFSELLLDEFTEPWTKWSKTHQAMTRNQAHGSPANIIDLYAAADIPECETFGSSYFPIPGLRRDSADIRPVDPDPVMLKFATSAANIFGKPLASSETFTWLGEHFKVALSQCKPELEQVFLAGVNHVFYHGTTYSPEVAGWPGWLFYASVEFVPNNSFWPHLRGLNNYIARTQSVLQAGVADNDLLVYWPVYDVWHTSDKPDMQISIHNIDEWLHPTAFYKESQNLMAHGYLMDFASDKALKSMSGKGGLLNAGGGNYKTLIIPACELLPLGTLQEIMRLAEEGSSIVFQALPNDVPGFHDLENRQKAFGELLASLKFESDGPVQVARVGSGRILLATDIQTALNTLNIQGESLANTGLKFIRRELNGDTFYYLVNHTSAAINPPVTLNSNKKSVILMNPDDGQFGQLMADSDGKYQIQLKPGQSIILRCTDSDVSGIKPWITQGRDLEAMIIDGPWKLTFASGGPALPASTTLDTLVSWTELADEHAAYFSGDGIYETTIHIDGELADDYLLDLGRVAESARVWINNQEAGILWSIPFETRVGQFMKAGENSIRIEVANLMANRIRYMDQQAIEWQKFHEINFVNIDYAPFNASGWEPMPSGLLGPVRLIAIDNE